jgi:hypothetical protein
MIEMSNMNLTRHGALLLLATLAGCATQAPAPKTVQIWENPGTEFPPMCMLMQADGTLAFKGGFQFYSPGKWRQDDGHLTITLGGTEPFPAEISKEQLQSKVGALKAYNAQRRELTYKTTPAPDFIGLGNFYFYRADSCHARDAG